MENRGKQLKVYLVDKKMLAYYKEQASPLFWDAHWQIDDLKTYISSFRSDGTVIPMVKKYLPTGSVILEGGCGRGQLVHALQYLGYKAIGVDNAPKTILKIKEAVPDLDIRYGDVRKLNIETDSLDGYISIGVIEHFWEGYQSILSEMYRSLKIGGILFLSFPSLSPLRKFKIACRIYQLSTSNLVNSQASTFYQFALDYRTVTNECSNFGFKLIKIKHTNGLKGFKDEVALFRNYFQDVFDGKKHKALRPWLEIALRNFAFHSTLLVLKKG